MRILVVGDTHANTNFFTSKVFSLAKDFGCNAIFVVGDFGFWPRFASGVSFLSLVSSKAVSTKTPVYFLDGNHEDFFALEDVYGGLSLTDDFIAIRKNLYYSPRGHRWEWDGVSFMTLGGAFSIDREFRTLGRDWFVEETIRQEDIVNACDGGKVDVMLTHDAPHPIDMRSHLGGFYKRFAESEANRRDLTRVVDVVQPKILIHGHYHVGYTEFLGETKVVGLAHDCWYGNISDQFYVLDTKDYR